MASKTLFVVVTLFLYLFASHSYIPKANAAGECGRMPIRSAAASLSPCLSTSGNARAKVPPYCCGKVGALIRTAPKCLCAVLLSPLAKQAGIKPGIAITIPKRCNIRNRPATPSRENQAPSLRGKATLIISSLAITTLIDGTKNYAAATIL
ncbi:hypothetical protein RJ639_025466 [Escallonia herrerae]|uniref:Bifunctional inhibitor/plant lipid transfer protein/seed storage helical domain-containing protein n=1 Tax=Escallonia herrerae TaxID=1293975 RepID=A0AA88UXM6_9ASTE|nr:hypothetical protein RJ639_025466 [Escallonia herrerae]